MRVLSRCALLAVLVPVATAQGSATLRATLDLREAVAAGWLDPTTETVGLRGSTALHRREIAELRLHKLWLLY